MKEAVSSELKFWKLALRETYYLDLITQSEMIKMHTSDFFYHIDEVPLDDKDQVDVVLTIMNNPELFANLLREEITVLSKGCLPDDKRLFKKMYLSYLLDIQDAGHITEEIVDVYNNSINFDSEFWTTEERELAQSIVELFQFSAVQENPKIVQFIENPSFKILMYVNDLEYV